MAFLKSNEKCYVEVTSSSWRNHHSRAELRETENLQNLSILFLKSLWVMLQLIFDAENHIIKYVPSRLSCEQLLSGSSLVTQKTKGKSVSNSKILAELKISNH